MTASSKAEDVASGAAQEGREEGRAEAAGGSERGAAAKQAKIPGDRGVPSINRPRSVQVRVSNLFAVVLLGAIASGLLTWYYARTLMRPARSQEAAVAASRNRAQGETALPSLGDISRRQEAQRPPDSSGPPPADSATATPRPSAAEQLLGPKPAWASQDSTAAAPPYGVPPGVAYGTPPQKSAAQLAFERRLSGPAFAHASQDSSAPVGNAVSGSSAIPASWTQASRGAGAGEEGGGKATPPLDALLRPTVTPAVAASVLPTRRFLLAKGAFIDCTLETAIDSTLPGMTTCVTATDTFSADGSVVLLERGTKLVGETRGEVQQGTSRIFVLWTEARTPTGVVVPLSSPGTDELGRSGLPGEVNRHFWDRFGAAILLTVINGAVQGAVNSQNTSGSVVVSPSTSTDVMTEVLKSTVSIPPTVTKAQGDRIQVFVARDVDFRSVYALHSARAGAAAGEAP